MRTGGKRDRVRSFVFLYSMPASIKGSESLNANSRTREFAFNDSDPLIRLAIDSNHPGT